MNVPLLAGLHLHLWTTVAYRNSEKAKKFNCKLFYASLKETLIRETMIKSYIFLLRSKSATAPTFHYTVSLKLFIFCGQFKYLLLMETKRKRKQKLYGSQDG